MKILILVFLQSIAVFVYSTPVIEVTVNKFGAQIMRINNPDTRWYYCWIESTAQVYYNFPLPPKQHGRWYVIGPLGVAYKWACK